MRLFLSGPVTGMEDHNKKAFALVGIALEEAGHEVFSPPHKIHPKAMESYAMKRCLLWLCDEAEGIVTLPGFCYSKGARVEVALAHKLGLPRWQVTAEGEFMPISHDRRLIRDTGGRVEA